MSVPVDRLRADPRFASRSADSDGQPPHTLLVTLTGADRPGVTALVLDTLGRFGVELVDIEQILLRGRLVLGVLVSAPRDERPLRRALAEAAEGLGMHLEVESGRGDNLSRASGRSLVTVLGAPLRAAAMAAVAGRIADTGANIDRIDRMARYPVTAIQLSVSGTDPDTLRSALAAEAARWSVDIAVRRSDITRHGARLVVMDVDSTLITGEVIEMLAAHAGSGREVAAITEAAMRGELDFEASLRARVRLLAGLPESVLEEVYAEVVLTPGARTLVRSLTRLGYRFALVSGGFTPIVARIAEDLQISHYRANDLEVVAGRLTGAVTGRVVDRAAKAAALREFARLEGIPISATVAIGDGANDLDMLAAAGLGIAYNAKPVVARAADTAVNVPFLDPILYLLGITREEVELADAEDGLIMSSPPDDSAG